MTSSFKKIIVKNSFETLVAQLKAGLDREGFIVSGVAEFPATPGKVQTLQFRKYQVFSILIPHLFQEMIMLSPFNGLVVPCNISVVESYPGRIELIPVNPTEIIVRGILNPSIQNLSEEVSRRMDLVLHALESKSTNPHDLITSWG